MAFAWADIFAPPVAISGWSSGAATDIDEWPPSAADSVNRNLTSGQSLTLTIDFDDLSAGPGDKKGFWFFGKFKTSDVAGIRIDEVRLIDIGGPTTLWTNSSPGVTVQETSAAAAETVFFRVPDSAFSGDPDIDQLRLEFDVTNLRAGNNSFTCYVARLSKSPFTAAQEASLPSTLSSKDFSCYRASDLGVLGAVDSESVVVWPDASGNGRHLLLVTGSFPIYKTGTPDYVQFSNSSGARFQGIWGSRITGNHVHHTYIMPTLDPTTSGPQASWSYANNIYGEANDGTDKNLLGIQDDGGTDEWVMMSGDGSPGAHFGSGSLSLNTWVRITEWVQNSGNEKMWYNDDASPVIDAASGANNMYSLSVGDREDDTRPFEGRIAEHWWIEDDAVSVSEANIDTARDEWVAGLGGTDDPANLVATVNGTDVDLTWDPSF